MKTPRKSVGWLLPLLLTGCLHKAQQAQNQAPLAPPIVDTPPPAPAPAPEPKDLPPPVVTVPPQSQPAPATAPAPKQPDKTVKHPAHHTTKPDQKTETKPAEQASSTNSSSSPEVSAIGQLSPGDPSDLRNQTEDSIASTQRGVNNLSRQLSDQEQKTVAQIKEFLKQAKTALTSGDVDGAHTLALKAKVLLGELNQQ